MGDDLLGLDRFNRRLDNVGGRVGLSGSSGAGSSGLLEGWDQRLVDSGIDRRCEGRDSGNTVGSGDEGQKAVSWAGHFGCWCVPFRPREGKWLKSAD